MNTNQSPQTKLMSAIFGKELTDDQLYESLNGITLKAALDEAFNSIRLAASPTLHERNKQIIIRRLGLEDGQCRTLIEVGKEFNVTRERVRQIEMKALRRLRHHTRYTKLRPYLKEVIHNESGV